MKCMWTNSAYFLIVRVRLQGQRNFRFPIPLRVVDEWFEALADLIRIGETALRFVPIPQEPASKRHMNWIRTLYPSRIIRTANILLKDLSHHKGLDVVDVDTGDVQVKIHLR